MMLPIIPMTPPMKPPLTPAMVVITAPMMAIAAGTQMKMTKRANKIFTHTLFCFCRGFGFS